MSIGIGESLLRRFNHLNPDHLEVLIDEGSFPAMRLRGSALRFDLEDDGTRSCSVYRSSVLADLSLPIECIVQVPYEAIAHTTRASVEIFRSGKTSETSAKVEFVTCADPITSSKAFETAHSLIRQSGEYESNSKRRAAVADLARMAFTIAHLPKPS